MRNLDFYKGNTEEEIFSAFLGGLQKSISGWDYFVNWKKVKNMVDSVKIELNLLNSLIGSTNIERDFIEILEKYPEVLKALPILIAVREEKLKKMSILLNRDTLKVEDVNNIFNSENIQKDTLLKFFTESGLKNIFEDRTVKSLTDYVTGVEVGMDTNGRKNRTGTLMEDIVEQEIAKLCEKKGYEYGRQMSVEAIKNRWGITIPTVISARKFDFTIFNGKEAILFETNFYSSGGTKLKATAGEYIELGRLMKENNIKFVWITDGLGWKGNHIPLREAFEQNDYIFNLAMIKQGILEEIL